MREELRDAAEQARIAAERLRKEQEKARRAAAAAGGVRTSRPRACEIERIVAERESTDHSTDWVERVRDAIVRAAEIVRAARTSHDTAEQLISARTSKTGLKGRKGGAGRTPRPPSHSTQGVRDDASGHEGWAKPTSPPRAGKLPAPR
jgi:hypothetical protein